MNLIDLAVIAVFVLVALNALRKGFMHTALSTALMLLSVLLAFIFMPVMANAVKADDGLFNTLLYYTEGSEFINDSELARRDITTLSTEEVNTIVTNANVPHPIGREIRENILTDAFAADSVVTLGDYFNQTMVRCFINIASFVLLFLCFTIVLGFLLNWFDYSYRLPRFTKYDALFALAASLLEGMLAAFVVFTVIPVALTLLPLDFVRDMIDESLCARLFYNSNFLLSLMPGV
ncbi:MAG: CvpA family protein [Clostridia bacterium]|nr:CvpA family protein [Clostridia bacterium]